MRTEYENMIKEFLPALRAKSAKRMESKGFSQQMIAQRLNMTQAAVSKYLSGKYSAAVKKVESTLNDKDVESFITNAEKGDAYEAQRCVCKMCSKNLTFDCELMVK